LNDVFPFVDEDRSTFVTSSEAMAGIAIRIARGCSMRSGSFFRTAEPRARL